MEKQIKDLLDKQIRIANLMNPHHGFVYLQGYTSALVNTNQITEEEACQTILKMNTTS